LNGDDIVYGVGSNQEIRPLQIRFSVPNGLVDPGLGGSITNFTILGFRTVCTKWQDNGNTNCLPQDLNEVPNPLSLTALFPIGLILKLRTRYNVKA
jgi:hypothetical protein